jgi:adenylate kinase
MVGAPGAGKGTQAALLAERLGIPQVASGDLFRSHVRQRTALGKKVKGYLESGALVPDSLTVQMISDRLGLPDAAKGAILDGFPRTRPQAQALDSMLAKMDGQVAAALYVDVPREELLRRLSGRWICTVAPDHVYHASARPPQVEGVCDIDGAPLYQRDDDKPKTVEARLEQQLPPMYEVVDYYAEHGLLSTVNANRPIDEVSDALIRAIAHPVR